MPGARSRPPEPGGLRTVVVALCAGVSAAFHAEAFEQMIEEVPDAQFLLQTRVSTFQGSAASAAATAKLEGSRKLLLWMLGHHGRTGDHGNKVAGGRSEAGITSPPTDNATCEGSGYFIDWGSSGMKVYRVHQREGSSEGSLSPSDAVEGSLEAFKLSGVGIHSSPGDVKAILDELLQHLPQPLPQHLPIGATSAAYGSGGAVLATAGMRLEPERADLLWDSVRSWANLHSGVFGRCGPGTTNADCKTLAGVEEAAYEMQSVLQSGPGHELEERNQPFGFASAGGASMQVGIRGPEAELESCRQDLGTLDANFDPQRAGVVKINGVPTLLVSFLSVTGLTTRLCIDTAEEQGCDYNVGGLDQMRARFDEYLVAHGIGSNPCLSEYAQLRRDEDCSFFHSTVCVIDRYGGKISGLPPVNGSLSGDHREAECRQHLRSFMDEDLVLGRWSSSPSCMGLAGNASRWALVSAFSREAQLGAHVDNWEAFGDVRRAASGLDFATEAAAERGEEGIFLTSMLLVHFLEVLGLSRSAQLRGMPAEWAREAIRERHLALGWARKGHCTGEPVSASEPQ